MNEVLSFFREIIPAKGEMEIGMAASVIGTGFCYVVGGWDQLVEALLIAMAFDYISGVIAACMNPEKKLDSQKGFVGILKKVMILLVVGMAHLVDSATGQDVLIRSMVVLFFLGNEGLSILENAANAGLPIPARLKETLEQYSKQKGRR